MKPIKFLSQADKVVVLPHYGEFGWLVLHYLRYVQALTATSKIVCCPKGDECYYPSATGFYHWSNPLADKYRQGDAYWRGQTQDTELRAELSKLYADHTIIRPQYDCHWHTSDAIKFKPVAAPELPAVDVAIAVRKRAFVPETNFNHWDKVIAALRSIGLKVGLLGRPDTSFTDLEADALAWNHRDGASSGTVDLLSRCRLYIGTDTGVSHLAALMDTPQLVWYMPHKGSPNMLGLMKRANKVYYRRLKDGYGNPDEIVGAALRCLAELATPHAA